jgi:hypothetical protein
MESAIKVVWLASYPKSGNTWLRFLLGELLAPGARAIESIPTLHESLPESPPLYRLGSDEVAVLKTHCAPWNARLSMGVDCVGAITIHRHPLDILLSSLNYLGFKQTPGIFLNDEVKSVEDILRDGEMDFYVDRFIEQDGVGHFSKMCGPWTTYQRDWDDFGKNVKYLGLRYEDMVDAPTPAVRALHTFFGLECTNERAATIVQATEPLTAIDGRFFWRKRAFNYRTMLSQEMIRRFCKVYESQLAHLGYSDE